MRTLRSLALRLIGIFKRAKDEREFDAQVQADIELYIEEAVRAGVSPQEARRSALAAFGGVDAAKEAWRDRRGIPFFETLISDVAHAFRVLGRSKGWAAVAIFSLALGVGATTAIFSAANSMLLRKLPLPAVDEMVTLRWQGENKAFTGIVDYGFVPGSIVIGFGGESDIYGMRGGVTGAYSTFKRLYDANQTLSHLFAAGQGPAVNLIVDGKGETASTQFVSGEFFAALGIPPAAGREILPTDDSKGAEAVAVVSHGYWLRRFGGDVFIVGKKVRVNTAAFTIVGIAGADTDPPHTGAPDLTIPLSKESLFQQGESRLEQTTNWWLVMMGRLKPGVTPAQVEANLGPVYEHATRESMESFLATVPPDDALDARKFGIGEKIPRLQVVSGARGAYEPLHPLLRTPLAILGILAGIVLLVVCVNLGNLSMAVTTNREREIAIRRAIGATPRRLIRQILTEHLVVAALGAGASLFVAYLFQDLIRTYFYTEFDFAVIAFAFTIAAVTGILIGIMPAVAASRTPGPLPTGGSPIRRSRLAAALLVAQVVMSLVLLIGAGLFLRTLFNLRSVNPGFDAEHVVLFRIDPAFSQYDAAKTKTLYDDLISRLGGLPGVTSVSFSSQALLDGNASAKYVFPEGAPERKQTAFSVVVHPDFFQTMGIPFRAGRNFAAQDSAAASQVVVINEALAKVFFGDANPIGRRIGTSVSPNTNSGDEPPNIEIVGVVGDTRYLSLRSAPPQVFIPHAQASEGARTFEVRTKVAPENLMPAIRQAVAIADPALPIISLSTQAAAIENQSRQERIIAMSSATLGALTLVVSMIGLFGLMSYVVARRTRDIAIRMALGAEPERVLRSVLREALVLVGVGAVIGLGVALATTRFLKSQLFGLAPNDPLVLSGAVILILVVSAAAAYAPARRAATVDPNVALREE